MHQVGVHADQIWMYVRGDYSSFINTDTVFRTTVMLKSGYSDYVHSIKLEDSLLKLVMFS